MVGYCSIRLAGEWLVLGRVRGGGLGRDLAVRFG